MTNAWSLKPCAYIVAWGRREGASFRREKQGAWIRCAVGSAGRLGSGSGEVVASSRGDDPTNVRNEKRTSRQRLAG